RRVRGEWFEFCTEMLTVVPPRELSAGDEPIEIGRQRPRRKPTPIQLRQRQDAADYVKRTSEALRQFVGQGREFSVEQIADQCEVGHATVYNWLAGKRAPSAV